MGLYDIALKTIDGASASLGDYRGKVLLVVNVRFQVRADAPSTRGWRRCIATSGIRAWWCWAFPANNFGAQEPGSDAEIAEFLLADLRRRLSDVFQDLGQGPGPPSAL